MAKPDVTDVLKQPPRPATPAAASPEDGWREKHAEFFFLLAALLAKGVPSDTAAPVAADLVLNTKRK